MGQTQVSIKQGGFPSGADENAHAAVQQSQRTSPPGWATQSEGGVFVCPKHGSGYLKRESVFGKTVPCLPPGEGLLLSNDDQAPAGREGLLS